MKPSRKVVVLAVALVIVNFVTRLVVRANLSNAIYPVDTDSISIPLFSIFLASPHVLPFFAVIVLFPTARFVALRCSRSTAWSLAVGLIFLVAYAAVSVYAITSTAYWTAPYHYLIALCYAFLFIGLAILFVLDTKFLFSNLRAPDGAVPEQER
jgi:hypothetical protein